MCLRNRARADVQCVPTQSVGNKIAHGHDLRGHGTKHIPHRLAREVNLGANDHGPAVIDWANRNG